MSLFVHVARIFVRVYEALCHLRGSSNISSPCIVGLLLTMKQKAMKLLPHQVLSIIRKVSGGRVRAKRGCAWRRLGPF